MHVVTVSRNNILSFMGSGGKKNPNLNEWELNQQFLILQMNLGNTT